MKTVIEVKRKHAKGQVAEGLYTLLGFVVKEEFDGLDFNSWVVQIENLPKSIKLENLEFFPTNREASNVYSTNRIWFCEQIPETVFKVPFQYGFRDIIELDKKGGHYTRHVQAMTTEKLFGKSEIAAELAFRDEQIIRLQKCLSKVMDIATGETQVGDDDEQEDGQGALEYIAELINEAGYEHWRTETEEEEV